MSKFQTQGSIYTLLNLSCEAPHQKIHSSNTLNSNVRAQYLIKCYSFQNNRCRAGDSGRKSHSTRTTQKIGVGTRRRQKSQLVRHLHEWWRHSFGGNQHGHYENPQPLRFARKGGLPFYGEWRWILWCLHPNDPTHIGQQRGICPAFSRQIHGSAAELWRIPGAGNQIQKKMEPTVARHFLFDQHLDEFCQPWHRNPDHLFAI